MASNILSYVPIVNRFVSDGNEAQAIDIPPVPVHNVETDPDKRARSLKHLLRANHVNHSILYHKLMFHNHAPHILGSAYLLGATDKQLHEIYEAEAKELEPWSASPAEVTEDDWRDFLGDKRYQRAYVDFFEDALALHCGYDWKKVVKQYMFEGREPLINGLIGGLGHPLIHLGYAYEIDNKEVAIEALGLTATNYNYLHKFIDDKKYTKPSPFSSKSIFDLVNRLANDRRFDELFTEPDLENLDVLFLKHEDLVLEYWNAWTITDPVKQFQESQELAVALLVATVAPGTHAYNFFNVHLLTTSHAIRILIPFIPTKFHISLVRQWWLFTLGVYIALMRPKIDPDNVQSDLKGRHWGYVEHEALNSQWAKDAHYVKAIRAMKEAATTWGDVHERYLASALTFVDNYRGWVFEGFTEETRLL
ncbi:Questin oxidase [Colletotrichum orbiculare MAFF 240422]|uniref:Questin oxidase n=1 Tax=Colletotrichum orbiculare (strain 104-T / ATCC 96160 / CBS 514.97 / LARS 414 / MAFF 240422) TaxID=1213857 RepID=N4USC8_COLOR|nr:Questin oxidase [Colletotrichum orbiculare MAFF 240422]